jgi:hypothetical protein
MASSKPWVALSVLVPSKHRINLPANLRAKKVVQHRRLAVPDVEEGRWLRRETGDNGAHLGALEFDVHRALALHKAHHVVPRVVPRCHQRGGRDGGNRGGSVTDTDISR